MKVLPDCIIVTCFGRWKYLAKTLPLMIDRTSVDIFVVSDRRCPDRTLEKLWDLPETSRQRVAPIVVHLDDIDGRVIFNKPKALNTGFDMCCGMGHEVALVLDADSMIGPTTFKQLTIEVDENEAEFAYVGPTIAMRDLTGILVARLRLLTQVGMDEGMTGWGAEDIDLRLALHCEGEKQKKLNAGLFAAISHDNELRSAHYANPDIHQTLTENLKRMVQNYYRRTGKRLDQEWKNPDLIELLGYGPIMEAFGLELLTE